VQFCRRLVVGKPVDEVFTYLSDFTTTTEWDPATVRTIRLAGDGGIGTTYRNVSRFLGREAHLDYRVVDLRPDELIQLRGENKTLVATDTMALRSRPNGTEIVYTAAFDLKGAAKVVGPLLRPAFVRLVDRGADGLRSRLERL